MFCNIPFFIFLRNNKNIYFSEIDLSIGRWIYVTKKDDCDWLTCSINARRPKFSFCGSQTIFSLQIKRQKTFQLRAICNNFNCLWHFSLRIVICPLSFCHELLLLENYWKYSAPTQSHFKVALLSSCSRKCEFWPASVRIYNTASRNFSATTFPSLYSIQWSPIKGHKCC